MPQLVLASTSPYRRMLLDRLGIPYVATPHRCDEEARSDLPLEALALSLAEAKAKSVAADHACAFILGSDQIAALDGERLGKPGSAEAARVQLGRLAGRTHLLLTGIALLAPDGSVERALDVHEMVMRPLSDDEIERYVAIERPLDCCGAYKIEGLGVSLFERTTGSDATAIVGLPLMALARLLRAAGFRVP